MKAYEVEFTANEIENVRINALGLLELSNVNMLEYAQDWVNSWYPESQASFQTFLNSAIQSKIVEIGSDGFVNVTLGKVSTTNRKLNELASATGYAKTQVVAFDLLAGKTCPFADVCKAQVKVDNSGKRSLVKADNCEFVCYAAKLEAVYGNVYEAHKHNTDIVDQFSRNRDVQGLAAWLYASLMAKSPNLIKKGGIVRWHASGDFHTATYVKAVKLVQLALPNVQFFGYSKSPWVVEALTNNVNAWMVFSHGSKYDQIAENMGIPTNYVRVNPDDYSDIPTACPTSMVSDDFFFIRAQKSFAINVH